MKSSKSFRIEKEEVWRAYKLVKANKGAAGVDDQSIEDFERRLGDNLFKIWNRMSSGSYHPPPVRTVEIPKKNGGKRVLGIPTVGDRVAQMVVKQRLEPELEPYFHKDSYGYRPGKSAHDALAVTRDRCWKYDWVVEFDIKGAFDNIDHALLLRALRKHTNNPWVVLYVERWLTAPFQSGERLIERTKGTPQGGVISPILANLFLHYAFDMWMEREYPNNPFCRYADDGLVHCRTLEEAQSLRANLQARFSECKLELNPDKTRIVYCKCSARRGEFPVINFDFLGYTFGPKRARSPRGYFVGYLPAVSRKATKAFRDKVRSSGIHRQVDKKLSDIADMWNPILRGWIQYYGRFYPSALYPTFNHFNLVLERWIRRKYRKYRYRKIAAHDWLGRIAKQQPKLFVHWQYVKPAAGR
jgi:RNA-directed DNA polymerase